MNSLTPIFKSLKKAQAVLALHKRGQRDAALMAAAAAIDRDRKQLLAANAKDVEKARKAGTKEALVDRLVLDNKRIDGIIAGIQTVVSLEDPLGQIKSGWKTANGLEIKQITVPLGVAAIIYESRPNVTADVISLAYKAGCAVLLRGSSSALESNRALVKAIKAGLETGGGIADAAALADSGDRGEVDQILSARGYIDVVIPRGGHDLISHVVENARIPILETGVGNCHIYVDESANLEDALNIIENAKLQKPGVCNAAETLLVHKNILYAFMPELAVRFAGKAEIRCDEESKTAITGRPDRLRSGESLHIFPNLVLKDAVEEDWETEFLDTILAVKMVHSLDEAIDHISRYSTSHSESIITGSLTAAEEFCRRVDAACVYVNASTRFTDGGEFGFGSELGISTQKLHARGPMGLQALTTIKYCINGQGHIRK